MASPTPLAALAAGRRKRGPREPPPGIPILSRRVTRGAQQDNRLPRGALIVVAVGLLACLAAAAARDRQGLGRSRRRPRMGAERRRAGLQAGRGPRRQAGQMQLIEAGIDARPGPTSAATRSSGSPALLDRRRLAGRQRPDPLRDQGAGRAPKSPRRRDACAPPTRAPAKTSSRRKCRKSCWSTSAPVAPNSRWSKSKICFEAASPPNAGVKLEWPDYEVGTERWQIVPAAGQAAKDLELPFSRSGKRPRSPRPTSPAP